jgi:hypothetical protein
LFALNDDMRDAFDGLLDMRAPPALSDSPISNPVPANTNRAPWKALAAMLVLGAFLGSGAAWITQSAVPPVQIAANRSWLAEVADYHQI